MNNNVRNKCINYCAHIEKISNVRTVILDIENGEFIGECFDKFCLFKENGKCNSFSTHLYGTMESFRWDGKYTYYCPCGFIFIASAIKGIDEFQEGAIITGPIIMSNDEDMFEEDNIHQAYYSNDIKIPVLTTSATRSLSEVIRAVVGYILEKEHVAADIDSGIHADLFNSMYEVSGNSKENFPSYPLELEKELLHYVSLGDKVAASDIINKILGHIYFTSTGDLEIIRSRTLELLAILSRSTIESGADANEIFWLTSDFSKRVNDFDDMESLGRFITGIIHKFISSTFDFANIKHRDIMFKVTEYIKANYGQKITLDELSEHVYLSKSYLSRLLKEELKCTFTEYVNKIRVEKSKILLMKKEIPIVDIAYAVGFDDQSYFTKVFKKITNVSPGKYREGRHKD